MWNRKKIVIGICGSIAAFKVAGWVSSLAKEEAIVDVVMTSTAKRFITPLTLSSLSGREVCDNMFDQSDGSMPHIDLGKEADLLVIAPASANTIAKLAYGMADSLLTTTALVANCPKLIFPAMNSRMLENPATQRNLDTLRKRGFRIVEPASGMMACKEVGVGRLVEWDIAYEEIATALSPQDFAGHTVLITAGPTREAVDPARFISNRSTGKMGYALSKIAARRGAKVVLISGPTTLVAPHNATTIQVENAKEMFDAVMEHSESADIIIKSAAVSDYRPTETAKHKIKKDTIEPIIQLKQNPDILQTLGKQKRPKQILVGFAAESRNLESEGKRKLEQKNLDLIAVNNISSSSTGFASDTNQVMLIDKNDCDTLPLLSKEETAMQIFNRIKLFLQ